MNSILPARYLLIELKIKMAPIRAIAKSNFRLEGGASACPQSALAKEGCSRFRVFWKLILASGLTYCPPKCLLADLKLRW
jgi:hypothetical protein